MQLGPSLDKRKLMPLVRGTGWYDFIELNRMAFSDVLPRNSESRAMAILFKLLKKHSPQLKWVISFADATQCGDGTIYRAAGFILTDVKENRQIYRLPRAEDFDGSTLLVHGLTQGDVDTVREWLVYITPPNANPSTHKMALEGAPHAHKMLLDPQAASSVAGHLSRVKIIMRKLTNGGTSADKFFRAIGGVPAIGYQLRYIKFLDPAWQDRLTVPALPYSRIAELNATMYKGNSSLRQSSSSKTLDDQSGNGGANPTLALPNETMER